MKKSIESQSASEMIDKRIAELWDWRGETLSRMRELIKEADPDVLEEVKWRKPSNSMLGVPVWSHDGARLTSMRVRRSTRAHSRRSSEPQSSSIHPAERQGSNFDSNSWNSLENSDHILASISNVYGINGTLVISYNKATNDENLE